MQPGGYSTRERGKDIEGLFGGPADMELAALFKDVCELSGVSFPLSLAV